MTPSRPQTLPKWLSAAIESKSHVKTGLRTLTLRELNRVAARQASEELDPKKNPLNVRALLVR